MRPFSPGSRGASRTVLSPLPVEMAVRWTGSPGVSTAPDEAQENLERLMGNSIGVAGMVGEDVGLAVGSEVAATVVVVVASTGDRVGADVELPPPLLPLPLPLP